jgi:hypothetical protein
MQVEEIDDFESVLTLAEDNANTEWEMDFVASVRDRFNDYADKCFISDKQLATLEKIARV